MERLPVDTYLLPLPAPPVSDPSRPWKTFRFLGELPNAPRFIQDGMPHLISSQNSPSWSGSLFEKVLNIDVKVIFKDFGLISYLRSFLYCEDVRSRLNEDVVQSRVYSTPIRPVIPR